MTGPGKAPRIETADPKPEAKRRKKEESRPMSAAVRAYLRAALFENATLKLVAFMLALTVFFLVHSDKKAIVNLSVGVSYTKPADKVLASRPPSEVRLTVRGSRRLIKRLDESEIERIHIDLPDFNGDFAFENSMVRLPAGLELVAINPATFPLRLERPLEREVPIEIRLAGDLPEGYEVIGRSVEPDRVSITGAESIVKRTTSVATRPINLNGHTESFATQAALAPPDQFLGIDEDIDRVAVTVDIAPRLGTKRLPEQPVEVVPGPGIDAQAARGFETDPKSVTVTLSGPMLQVRELEEVPLQVSLTATDLVPGTSRKAPVVARGLPEGIAHEIRPSEVTLVPRTRERPRMTPPPNPAPEP